MRKFVIGGAACAAALLLAGCKAEDGAGALLRSQQQQPAPAASKAQAPSPTATPDEKGVRRVGPEELQKMLEAGEAVAVDVRLKTEYDKGHIKGALSIPRNEVAKRSGELPKDKLVVFYCA